MYTKTFTTMNEPKVELKNIKTFRGNEGTGFNLDLYINGVKCMFVIDSANGGMFDYEHNIKHKNPELVKTNIELLGDYIKSLPPKEYEFDGKKHTLKYDFDSYIDEKLLELEEQKHAKKMQKLYKTAIVVGIPNGTTYSYYNYKRPLSEIPQGKLQQAVMELQLKLKKGQVIFNTNLEELGIKI